MSLIDSDHRWRTYVFLFTFCNY